MSRRYHLDQLRDSAPVILPSLLTCDFGNLEREVAELTESGVKALHLDVMDGNFVPNLTYGMPIVESLRRITDATLDVHLMITDPMQFIGPFYEAGADIITFHVEAVDDPRPILEHIKDLGAGAGIALNPGTPVSTIEDALDLCDLVLVMSVEAGFGGQSFQASVLDKLRQIRHLASKDVLLEVDGGVNSSTIVQCAEAGAQLFVVGSAIFGNDRYESIVSDLNDLANIS